MKKTLPAMRGWARAAIVMLMMFVCAWVGFAQAADPSTVKPAWQIEKELVEKPVLPMNTFSTFFVGYNIPRYSGTLAADLQDWEEGRFNISLGMDTSVMESSSMLNGIEADLSMTFNDSGSRMLMNSMAIFGYSVNLMPVRLNLGARLGLSIIDVTDERPGGVDYMGLGYIVGPEASLYLYLGTKTWIWARGRYSYAQYATLDNAASPLNLGRNQLSTVSIQAGLAFDL